MKTLPSFAYCIIAASILGCSTRDESDATAATQAVESPRFVFVAPVGFEERPEQKLYYHPGIRASIAPSYEAGADFEVVTAGFTKADLLAEGVELLELTSLDVEGCSTLSLTVCRFRSFNGKPQATANCDRHNHAKSSRLRLAVKQKFGDASLNRQAVKG